MDQVTFSGEELATNPIPSEQGEVAAPVAVSTRTRPPGHNPPDYPPEARSGPFSPRPGWLVF